MKRVNWILSIGIIAGLTLYSSCGTTDPPTPLPEVTPQDLAKTNLSKNWGIGTTGSVRRDGQDVTDDFSSFTVVFVEGGSYTSSGGGDVWPDGSGTWAFTSTDAQDASSITVGTDNIEINVSVTSLLMQFNIADTGAGIGARVSGIDGDWEISMGTN